MARTNPAVTAILNRTADPASVVWAHDGAGELSQLGDVEAAVAAAVLLNNVSALQIAAQSPDKRARRAAAVGVHRLRSAGVAIPVAAVAPRAFSLERETVDELLRAFMSVPDENGDIEVILTIANELGSAAVGAVLGGPTGLRDLKISWVARSGVREVWRAAERNRAAEVPFVTALHFAAPYGPTHDEWGHFVKLLPPGLLQSAQFLDPLARRLPGQTLEPAAVVRWMPNPDLLDEAALGRALGPLREAVVSPLHPDDDARRAAMDAVMTEAADASLTVQARLALVKHIELTMAALWLSGWDRHHAVFAGILAEVAEGRPGSAIPSVEACVKFTLAQTVIQGMQAAD